jgi:uncharacterized coiled-coil DUF342 family protein
MKYSILVLALSLGIMALPPLASAQSDRDYHYDDWKDYHDGIHHLREHYDRVREEADRFHANRHQRDTLYGIRDEIDHVAGWIDSGHYETDRTREKISRLHADLHGLSEDLRHNEHRIGVPGISIQIR